MSGERALSRLTVLQLLRDDTFYAHVPTYLFMREAAREVTDKIFTSQEKVGTQSQAAYAAGHIFQMFARHTQILHDFSWKEFGDGRLLVPLANYITNLLGYRPEPIVLVTVKDDQTHRLEF